MSSRIEQIFSELKKQQKSALIPFIMGGDPDLETSGKILASLPVAGADIIEIGIPFSDPMADGPVIQAAGLRSLEAGTTLGKIIGMVAEFRKNDEKTPIILMGYYNPIYRYGAQKFCEDATAVGVDGVIIVDLPPEEEGEIHHYLIKTGLKLIRLIAPTSNDERIKLLTSSASGFVYYISVAGITGAKSADKDELEHKVEHLRTFTDLPVAVGFGIKTKEQVDSAAKIADAVVVGSALVNTIAAAKTTDDKITAATTFLQSLK